MGNIATSLKKKASFYRVEDLPGMAPILEEYDYLIRSKISSSYRWPIRMRHWELAKVLEALPRRGKVLETGSFNTFMGIWLSHYFNRVIVSDLFAERIRMNLLRLSHIYRFKPTEAPFWLWFWGIWRSSPNIQFKTVDLTRIPFPDESFDCVTSISVIEHIPAVEKALGEMYRVLKPGGKMLVTTDCAATPHPYAKGVRYFSPEELRQILSPYGIEVGEPDFSEKNWCYGKNIAMVTCFFEITKP